MEQPNAHVPCSHKSQCNIPLGERLHHYTTVKRQEVDNSSCKGAGFTSLFPCVLIDVWIWSGAATELRFLTFASLSDTLPHPPQTNSRLFSYTKFEVEATRQCCKYVGKPVGKPMCCSLLAWQLCREGLPN